MHLHLLKAIAAIWGNRTVKAEMRIHLALHFLRYQIYAFTTTALLQKKLFNKVTALHTAFPPSAFFLKYEPLLKADTFLTLFQMIMSSQPCKRRYFISLVLDGQFQNNSCWMWYWAALPFTPKEKLEMSCPVLRGWNSWIAVSTL